MNVIDQAKTAGQAIGGRTKQVIGVATGNRDLEYRGQMDEMNANFRRAGGQVKNAAKSLRKALGLND